MGEGVVERTEGVEREGREEEEWGREWWVMDTFWDMARKWSLERAV